jgi:heat-inducible transcriptional repressor
VRQGLVLSVVVSAYVGEASPVGSGMISVLLPVNLSPASVRNTLAELTELGLVEKPHASAGRVPTERGLRVYVDELLDLRGLADYEIRTLTGTVDDAGLGGVAHAASRLLSEQTRQLGFVLSPRIDRMVLRHVSFVRLSTDRVLVVLVSPDGRACQRVIEERGDRDQPKLDRMATDLNERVAGKSLAEVRRFLIRETEELRSQAERLLARAVDLGAEAGADQLLDEVDLVIATRLALLDQPEFRDPDRIRKLFGALEEKQRLVEILDRVLEDRGVKVAFGNEVEDPALRNCALVAAPYGDELTPLGVLGVIGPSRMNYGRVIPLVDFLSQLLTERLRT